MSNLIIFGDSNSLPFFGNPEETEKYKVFKNGNLPKGWMELLSEKLNYKLISFAKMGYSNADIFQSISKNITQINENDIVLIGWTFRMRYQVISKYDKNYFNFSSVLPSFLPETSLLSDKCMEEFLIHKNHEFWVNEIYAWEKLLIHLSKLIKFKLFFWSFDDEIGRAYKENCDMNYYLGKGDLYEFYLSENYKNLGTNLNVMEVDLIRFGFWRHIYNLGMRQIYEETNGQVNDGHMDEMGHKILFELFNFEMEKKWNSGIKKIF